MNSANAMAESDFLEIGTRDGRSTVLLKGDWTIENAASIERAIASAPKADLTVRAEALRRLDTSGALLLKRLLPEGVMPDGLDVTHRRLLEFLPPFSGYRHSREHRSAADFFAVIGREAFNAAAYLRSLFVFIGRIAMCFVRALARPRQLRFPSIVRHVEETGVDAVMIVGLLAVLISMVIVYQGAVQLRRFGAGVFTIDLMVVALLREMGVLVTAIMVAGRSGSSYAAEIGVMTLREEVNALKSMGLDPIEVLVVPRLLALVITLPLLTFIADVVGLGGGSLMSIPLLGVSVHQYFARVRAVATITMFFVGMIKAPVFAFAIAAISCHQGMSVSGSAESVGRRTTLSVVQSIFVVIMADALFSVIFSEVGL
jgi:phospholipid/cholesterol/gamma-HCH transport system permease protein